MSAVTLVTSSYVAPGEGFDPLPDASALMSDARSIPTAWMHATNPPSPRTVAIVSG